MPTTGLNRRTRDDGSLNGAAYDARPAIVHRNSGDAADSQAQTTHSIGDLASEFGISLRTLRFYEARGLISPRRDGVTRIYSEQDRLRIARILKGKRLNFTLTEIDKMLERDEETATELTLGPEECLRQIEHLARQRSEIDAAINELTETYNALTARGGS